MLKLLGGALFIGWLFNSSLGFAAAASVVHVAVGKVSEVVLPEKAVKIIKGGAADSVLVEALGNSIYLLPKTATPANIIAAGASGKTYALNLVVSLEHDMRVDINDSSVKHLRGGSSFSVMDLMKELLLGNEPAGATVLKGGQVVDLEDGRIKLTIETVYQLQNLTAYSVKATNMTNNSVVVPLQQITLPNLLASASDVDTLKANGEEGDSAKIYIIAGI